MNDDRNTTSTESQDEQDVEQLVEAQANTGADATEQQMDGEGELDDRTSKACRLP